MININELALPVINTVVNGNSGVFAFRYFLSQADKNGLGIMVPTYSKWYGIRGNVQYVPKSMYQDLGLDFAKSYINAWGSVEIYTLDIKKQPDQLCWGGWLWNVTSQSEWNLANGWVNVTAARDKRYDPTKDK